MDKYVKSIPLETRNAIKALSDDNRQAILIYLFKEGPKSFTEIIKQLEIPKSNLSHHLKVLIRYGLIYNYYNKNEFDDKYSFYKISKFGNKTIDLLNIAHSPINEVQNDNKKDWNEKFPNATSKYPLEDIIEIQNLVSTRKQLISIASGD